MPEPSTGTHPAAPGTAPAPFAVGAVLPLDRGPGRDAFAALRDLLTEGVPAAGAAALRDPRIPEDVWPQVLARDVAFTVRWAARRALARAGREPAARAAWHGRGRVLALLPAHGHAVHLIRRALPFAVCGTPVLVAGHAHQHDEIAAAVALTARLLRLPDGLLATAPRPAPEQAAAMTADDLVVLTGSPATAATVRRATRALLLGATGGCVVLAGPDGDPLGTAATALGAHDHPGSCTRLGGVWHTGAPHAPSPLWHRTPPAGPGTPAAPGAVLRAAHPSAVFRLGGCLDDPPQDLAGYAVLPCDGSGTVGTLTGFGRDPRQGWPGDFLA